MDSHHESVAIDFIPLLDNGQSTWIVVIPQLSALNLIIRHFIIYMHVFSVPGSCYCIIRTVYMKKCGGEEASLEILIDLCVLSMSRSHLNSWADILIRVPKAEYQFSQDHIYQSVGFHCCSIFREQQWSTEQDFVSKVM